MGFLSLAQLIVVVIIIIIVIVVSIEQPREARLLPDDDNDGLGAARQHAIALQRGDRVLDLFHQTAFAAAQPAHAPTRMLAEVDDANDAAFLVVLRRFAFDICGHAHAHLLKIWRDADFDIDVPASADE